MTTEKIRRLLQNYKLINSDMIFSLIETQLMVIEHTPYSDDYEMLLASMIQSHVKALELQLKLARDIQAEVSHGNTKQLLLTASPYLSSSSDGELLTASRD